MVAEFFQKLAMTLIQRALRNTKVNARANTRVNARVNARGGETRVGKCVPDIDVGRAQWRVIIGVRICLDWSGGVICLRRKCLDTGVSVCS